jgi:cardiolipin synthase A/B
MSTERRIPDDESGVPRNERMDRALARTSDAPLRGGNRLTLLENGPDTYDEWLGAIEGAERFVHLENYIFLADGIGRRFAAALSKKASSGVPVRVLYDWFGCLDVPRSFWQGMREAGVEVRVVNPPTLGEPLGVARRDHRKVICVDGTYASTGGVCIADGWLTLAPETNLPYRDTAVSVRGPAVADLDRAFAAVWDEAGVRAAPLPVDERPTADGIGAVGDQAVRVVIQEPSRMRMLRMLQLLAAGVERRLWITDPYFVSMPVLTQALLAASRDGVDVRVLLPATNDLPWIGLLSRTGYRQFLEAGVRLFEYAGPMIHAKTVVADGWWSKVGSTNLNVSSLSANWELDLVAEDRPFAAKMEEVFDRDLDNAREIKFHPSSRRPKVRPEAGIDAANRRARRRGRRGVVGTGSGASATAFRVGSTALQKGSAPLQTHERGIAAAVSALLLAVSLLTFRFPRLISYPLALVGTVFGGLAVIRSLRSLLQSELSALVSEESDED